MPLYKVVNEAGRVEADFPLVLTKDALEAYKLFNPEYFPENQPFPAIFEETGQLICKAHGFKSLISFYNSSIIYTQRKPNNQVLLACSGGLDSVYQALYLKEKGYDVILFHVNNLNYYSNGKEQAVVNDIATHLNLPLISVRFVANTRESNWFKKFWAENSFKDMLFYSIMIDYASCKGIYNISSGDDLSLDISKAVVGTNLSDARQVTEAFIRDMKKYYDFEFIPTEQNHKGMRLEKLKKYDLLDSYYSCVNPGRFNQQNHRRIKDLFGVNLYKYNCGLCRKCAFHNLLRYYYLKEPFSQDFINLCWERIAIGADKVFFDKSLPLETRIENLYDY